MICSPLPPVPARERAPAAGVAHLDVHVAVDVSSDRHPRRRGTACMDDGVGSCLARGDQHLVALLRGRAGIAAASGRERRPAAARGWRCPRAARTRACSPRGSSRTASRAVSSLALRSPSSPGQHDTRTARRCPQAHPPAQPAAGQGRRRARAHGPRPSRRCRAPGCCLAASATTASRVGRSGNRTEGRAGGHRSPRRPDSIGPTHGRAVGGRRWRSRGSPLAGSSRAQTSVAMSACGGVVEQPVEVGQQCGRAGLDRARDRGGHCAGDPSARRPSHLDPRRRPSRRAVAIVASGMTSYQSPPTSTPGPPATYRAAVSRPGISGSRSGSKACCRVSATDRSRA